jgi:membrane-associated phospholipid phosphatase
MKKFKLLTIILTIIFNSQNIYAKSPYSISWGKESIIAGTGIVSALISSGISYNIKPLTQAEISLLNKNDINSIDRSATNYYSPNVARASDVLVVSLACTPGLFITSQETRNDIIVIGTMYAETMLFSNFLPSYTKGGIERIRPFVYNPDAAISEKLTSEAKRSFFSGHTTNAFASAVFLSTVYSNYYPDSKWTPYIWGGSLLAASSVGYMRYRAGKHFPTDILVGAAVGSAIGYLIPKFHENKKSDLTLIPFLNVDKAFISLNYTF